MLMGRNQGLMVARIYIESYIIYSKCTAFQCFPARSDIRNPIPLASWFNVRARTSSAESCLTWRQAPTSLSSASGSKANAPMTSFTVPRHAIRFVGCWMTI